MLLNVSHYDKHGKNVLCWLKLPKQELSAVRLQPLTIILCLVAIHHQFVNKINNQLQVSGIR